MTEYSRFNLSTSSVELLWISINNPTQKKIIVGNVYRPPKGDFREFVTRIKEMVNGISVNNLEVFLIGDCNVDYSKHGTCNKKLIKEVETLTGLHQIIKQPTRYGNNSSLIDLVFSNSNCINKHGTLDLNVSAHEAIFIIRKKSKEKFNIIDGYGRSYLNYEKNSFQANVRAADWSKLSEIRDINEYWNIIEETIKKVADTMYPLKKIKIKDKGNPWMTHKIIELLHDKDRLRKKAKKSGKLEDWQMAKQIRNIANNTVKRAKINFIQIAKTSKYGAQDLFEVCTKGANRKPAQRSCNSPSQ